MQQELHDWFLENARAFPWREEKTPYRVWISEVMLQQTRASVVVSYFHKWMGLFPTIEALSKAKIEDVIKAWEGLGYYSRARNLHKAAQEIVALYGGHLPNDPKSLEKISGIGPYTKGAILSFAFHKRAAAVDGNVLRVMSRLFLIEENIEKAQTKSKITKLTEEFLDKKSPWITMEALIELGATLCQKTPRCEDCPIRRECLAYKEGKAYALPIKQKEAKVTFLFRIVCLICSEGAILVKKEGAGLVMADLYQFPYLEKGKKELQKSFVEKEAKVLFTKEIQWERALPSVTHSFTRYKAHLFPHLFSLKTRREFPGYVWVDKGALQHLPFSSGHRKIKEEILKHL